MVGNVKVLSPELVEKLLQCDAPKKCFNAYGFETTDGLNALLNHATELTGADPGQARRIALWVELHAVELGNSDMIPQARYLRAQSHALDADFSTALSLIESAFDGFTQNKDVIGAARTHMGRMVVLQQMGRFPESLATGNAVITLLMGLGSAKHDDVSAIEARAHHNMGGCYVQMGEYAKALDSFAQAHTRYKSLDMKPYLGQLYNDRGVSLMYLGRVREAQQSFEAAFGMFDDNQTIKRADMLHNVGYAHLLVGNYGEALRSFDQVRELIDPLAAQEQKIDLLLDVADAHLSLNLFDEALMDFEQVEKMAAETGMTHQRGRAMWGMGSALAALGRWQDAQPWLDRAEQDFQKAGNAPMRAMIMLRQGMMYHALEQPTAARSRATEALACIPSESWPQQHALARLALVQLDWPDTEAARTHLTASAPLIKQLDLPNLNFLFHLNLGRTALLENAYDEAETHLKQACAIADTLRNDLNTDHLRVAYGMDKSAAYEALTQLYLERNNRHDIALAWDAAERARARALVELMAAPRAESKSENTEQQHALRALQNELNIVYSGILKDVGVVKDPAERAAKLSQLNARATELEREINREQLRSIPTREAEDAGSEIAGIAEMQAMLPAQAACVAYFACSNAIYAFVIRPDRAELVGNGPIAQMPKLAEHMDHLMVQWDRFRAGADFAARHGAQLEASARKALSCLHKLVFAAVEPHLAGCDQLVIVPHGRLHQLPFQALFDGSEYLIDRFTISYAPSATAYALCATRGMPTEQRALAVGVDDELIPHAREEASNIAQLLNARALVGADATFDNVLRATEGATLMHFACHGLFRAGNPMFSSLKLHDRWLLAMDANHMRLANALVTLSACESGRSTALAGDEVMGLTRAFLGAGASTLVVSLWIVPDAAVADMMRDWYDLLTQHNRTALTLRTAQLKSRERHSHPYYWASFVAIGKA